MQASSVVESKVACACVVGNRVVGTCVVETKVVGACVVENKVVGTSWKKTGSWVLSERERGGRSFVVENEMVDIQR